MSTVRTVLFVLVLVLAPLATAAVGYYLGSMSGTSVPAARTPSPTWIDREILRGDPITMRCIYHLGDGTTRVRDQLLGATCAPTPP